MKRTLRAFAAVIGLSFAAGSGALAQDLPTLLTGIPPSASQGDVHPYPKPGLLRQRTIVFNAAVLAQVRSALQRNPAAPVQVSVPAFEDTTLVLSITRVQQAANGSVEFLGTVNGDPLGSAALVMSHGLVAGTIQTGGHAYQIAAVGGGKYQVQDLDRAAVQDEAGDVPTPHPAAIKAAEQQAIPAALATDDGSTIDLFVAYTTNAKQGANNCANVPANCNDSAPILAQIDLAVATTNQAYANSGVVQRVRLVGTQEEIGYTEVGGDLSTDLYRLSNVNSSGMPVAPDGFLDDVQTARDNTGADIVSLWVAQPPGNTSNVAGLGWLMDPNSAGFAPFAYNVVVWDTATSNLTLPHEMGHNMGLRHDSFVDSNTTTPYPYAHGYVDTTHRFRTVMAYNDRCAATTPGTQCSRVTAFSSPLFTTDGGAITGNAANADAARALNTTRTTVANFRSAVAVAGTLVFRNAIVQTNEGAGTVQIPVARLGGASGAASVNWSTTAVNAVDGTDFTSSNGTLNWNDGDSADKNISVAVLQDSVADGEKIFTVALSGATGAVLPANGNVATVKIADDEPDAFPLGCTTPSGWTTPTGVAVGWYAAQGTATEGSCSFRSHNIGPAASCSVPLAFTSAQSQFTGTFLGGNITFDARVSSYNNFGCLQFSVDGTVANTGSCADANEILDLPGLAPDFGTNDTGWKHFSVPVTAGTHTVKLKYQIPCVTDGDNAAYVDNLVMPIDPASVPTLSFSQPTYNVTEGGPMVTVQVSRTGPSTGAVGVAWATANGTAVAGTDFGTLNNVSQRSGTLSWIAGDATPKMISVGGITGNVPVINNALVQSDRSFGISLSAPTGGAALGAQASTTVNILDDDSVFAFDNAALMVNEAGPNAVLNVTRTGSLNTTATVAYSTLAGTALAGTRYTTTAGTLSFGVGESNKAISIGSVAAAAPHIPVINDAIVQGPQTFSVKLASPTGGGQLGSPSTSTITIVSDDNGVAMASATQSIAENAGAVDVQVLRLGSSSGQVTVNYAFTNGSAINGTNYTGVNGQLIWPDTDTTPKTIHVPVIDDSVVNPNRTFTVTLSAATGAVLGTPASTLVTILDNDNTVQFSAATASVTEGASLTLNVTRVGGAAAPASVQWSTANGTAVAGTDFGALGVTAAVSGTLNWGAGDSAMKSVVIPTINDTTPEGARTFTVSLASPAGASIGAIQTVNVTMNDNDAGFLFASPTYTIAENGGNVMLSVMRVGSTAMAGTVMWTTANGTAIAGSDFGTLGSASQRSGTLSWAAGDGTAKTITIPILNDAIAEPDETFTVTLQNPSAGFALGTTKVATVTILDDDIPPESELAFSLPKYLVMENAGSVLITVNRNDIGGGFGRQAQVNYATANGTAMSTSDYTTRTGTLTWLAGDSAPKTFTVPIVNDSIAESPEQFTVNLSKVTPGTRIATPSTTVLIVDDDEVFPPQGAFPANWVTPLSANAGWSVSNDPGAYEGVFTLKSDQVSDSQVAQTSLTGTFVAGTVSFRVRISSELGFDFLRFYVDGVQQPSAQWSGTASSSWVLYSVPLTAGAHTLMWSYEKDGSASLGQDAAWIDAVTTPAYTP